MADEMEMIPVTSSQIESVGYNPETKEMRVRFKNQSLYTYANVPEETYQALMSAPSAGQYFAGIKYAFPYERIE